MTWRLVDHHQEVVAEVVDERVRGLTRAAPVEVTRVVLDAAGESHRLEHLEIVVHPHLEALGLEQLAVRLELREPHPELLLDRAEGLLELPAFRDVVRRRPHGQLVEHGEDLAGQLVHLGDRLDLVAEELHAHGVVRVRREHVEHVTPDAERAARQLVVVAVVLDVDEIADEIVAVVRLPRAEEHRHARVVLGRADAVDAADAGDDHDVLAREQRRGGRMPELLDLLVDAGVLLDEGVGRGHVGLGLVVVVVADEVHDGVVRQEVLQLRRELGGERLVGRHDQRRLLDRLDDLGHRERLARAGDSEQRLVAQPVLDTRA